MATIMGIQSGFIKWNPDFQASEDDKGKITASESFTCRLSDVTQLLPVSGSTCQHPGWTLLKYNGFNVENIEGDLAKVNVSYIGYRGEDGDFDFDNEEIVNGYSTELGITTGEEPIETNYRFKDISTAEKKTIQKVKNGQLEEDPGTPYSYRPPGDPSATPETISSDLGKELVDLILKGITSFLQPGQIWRVTYTSKNKPSSAILNKVGKITSAKGAPSVSESRNWLFIGCSVSESARIYTITLEWQLSGPGGFITNLYN